MSSAFPIGRAWGADPGLFVPRYIKTVPTSP